MPPKRKPTSETSQASNSKKHKLVENINDVKEAGSVPTMENIVKKRGRKPKANKEAQEPVVAENSSNPEGTASLSMQTSDNAAPEKSVTKPRKPRAKKQVQEIHHDPLSIENLLIHPHQEQKTGPVISDVSTVPEVVNEKKPRKPRTKKQPHSGPLAIDNLLIHTSQEPESVPVIQDSTDALKKPIMVRNENHSLEESINQEVDTSSKPPEIVTIPQELPVKKSRKPRTKKQEIPIEHPNAGNAISSVQSDTPDNFIANSSIHQITNIQIKPTESNEILEINNPKDTSLEKEKEDVNAQNTHVDEPGRKVPTKRGRPRKVDTKGSVNENDGLVGNTEDVSPKSPNPKRGRPRKEKPSEILPDGNGPESPINIVIKENDESTQKASSKRGRPRKMKQSETVPKEEHLVKPPATNIIEEKKDEEIRSLETPKKRRGRPKKENIKLTQDITSESVLPHEDKTEEVKKASLTTQQPDIKSGGSQPYFGNSLEVLASVSLNAKEQNQEKIPEAAKEVTEQTIINDRGQNEEKEKVKEKGKKLGEIMEEKVVKDEASSDDDSEQDSPVELTSSEIMKKRFDTLQKLRERRDQAEQINRKETYEEHQRKKINTKETIRNDRKREEAEKLLARKEAEEKGEDYERKQFWNYSVEEVEKWEKKQERKHKHADIEFTDYNQVARKKYKKMINNITPDRALYNEQKAASMSSNVFYRDANSLQYAGVENSPSKEAVDRLTEDVNNQISKREKFSRQKPINDDDDITYINERNRRFNDKIGRFYDKFTQETRENFERGTAL
ncbi:hypothetical protein Glove_724g5 [Diversispora epigaea]|uniref:Pre-mRNA-splicing factor SYF2 n=1 Tax=Diversispora epigaea TaxID=1348612 RepID=A0A397G543_9GLOM|nr:hypothetical protein Glove_724g5 [Diversispora epigaea]